MRLNLALRALSAVRKQLHSQCLEILALVDFGVHHRHRAQKILVYDHRSITVPRGQQNLRRSRRSAYLDSIVLQVQMQL